MTQELFKILENKGLYKCNRYSQKEIVKHFYQAHTKKVYLVKKGILKISYSNELGDKITSILLMKGDFFGFGQLFSDSSLNYDYEAMMDDTVLHEFFVPHISSLLDTGIISTKQLFSSIGKEYSLLERRIIILQNRFIKKRLCKTLSDFKKNLVFYTLQTETIDAEIPINQEELACYIRASRIITNKILNELKKNMFHDCLDY